MKAVLPLAFLVIAISSVATAATTRTYRDAVDLDLSAILPLPPTTGSEREADDRRIFRETRRLAGTPRWRQAIDDTDESTASLLRKFGCAAGRDLAGLPHVRAILETAAATGAEANDRAKAVFRRPRPFTMEAGPTCQSKDVLSRNYDYPSGHAARGWMWGYILASLMPDRAQPIIAEAKDFAQSRVICGAHSESAVEASSISAAVVLARLQGDSAFRQDMAKARREIAGLTFHQPAMCPAHRL
jgi:acid phosphatase (class A)